MLGITLANLALFFGSYLSGFIPIYFNISSKGLRLMTIFGSGLLISAALVVIIPEGVTSLYSSLLQHNLSDSHSECEIENPHLLIGMPLILGFLLIFILDQAKIIYHLVNYGLEKFKLISISDVNESELKLKRAAFVATLGLVIHSISDGLAVGSAYVGSEDTLKVVIFLAIIFHKAPAAFGYASFLKHSNQPVHRIRLHLLIFSLSAPISSFITYLVLKSFSTNLKSNMETNQYIQFHIAEILLFSGGTFLYVSIAHVLSDLIHSNQYECSVDESNEDIESLVPSDSKIKQESKNKLSFFECMIVCFGACVPLLSRIAKGFLDILQTGPSFDNLAATCLPLDKVVDNYVRQVPDGIYSRVAPTPVLNPQLVLISNECFNLIDLSVPKAEETVLNKSEIASYLSGNKIWPKSIPISHCYCGYQFGSFAGQLGDGAAITLGDLKNSNGDRWEVQLKGAGLTPYSRTADGRKVLRSSLREFLCSEAMYFLGIPTTRALAIVTSDTKISRDPFYNGKIIMEKASITTRLSPTFIRFGSFEIANLRDPETGRSGPSLGNWGLVDKLAKYTIKNFYPQIWTESQEPVAQVSMYTSFYREVVQKTAKLVAHWQAIGFCHGVLNTDNMSILGLTIDYGPFGFIDRFDWNHTCNGSDHQARYSYKNQVAICEWNCRVLASSLSRAMLATCVTEGQERDNKIFEKLLFDVLEDEFKTCYTQTYRELFRKKLGLLQDKNESDDLLVKNLLDTMHETGADFTNCFVYLESFMETLTSKIDSTFIDRFVQNVCFYSLDDLRKSWKPKLSSNEAKILSKMFEEDPESITKLLGHQYWKMEQNARDFERVKDWTKDDKRNSDSQKWHLWFEIYRQRLLDESCASDVNVRLEIMKKSNPRVVLRNYLAEFAIKDAEKEDYSTAQKLFNILKSPFNQPEYSTSDISTSEDLSNLEDENQLSLMKLLHATSNGHQLPGWARSLCVT